MTLLGLLTVPTLAVCRMARRHVTVALSGDGGDEVFAGYRRYRKSVQAVFQDPFASLNPRMRISTIIAEPLVTNETLSSGEVQLLAEILGQVRAMAAILGFDPDDPHWGALRHDLVAGLGTPAWLALAAQRVRAPLATFAGR